MKAEMVNVHESTITLEIEGKLIFDIPYLAERLPLSLKSGRICEIQFIGGDDGASVKISKHD